ARLRTAQLVAGQQHRHALAPQQRRQHVARLAGAQGPDLGIVGRAFDAAVPAFVVAGSVLTVLAIGLVVRPVVADQVGQGGAVLGGDEIDAGPRPPAVMVEAVGGAAEPRRQVAHLARVAAPVLPDVVAEAVVPFRPARREAADPVAVGAQVPRLGDQL